MPYMPALNNPYYQQQMQALQQLQTSPQVMPYQQQNGPTKVNGPQSALQMGYGLGPNRTSEAIFDLNGKVFYIVTTDGAGMPTVESFDFFPHVNQPTEVGNQYVSRSEFDNVIAQLKEAIDEIHGPVQADTTA